MDEHDDEQLLQTYIAGGSECAFAALVRRHVDLVYGAARRQCHGDAHLAEDVTQAVFIILARRAATIRNTAALSSWLISTTRYTANNAIALAARRRRHEREAAAMAEQVRGGGEENNWAIDPVAPLLDDALAALGETDRGAVTMRFLQGRSLRDVGVALNMSEGTAQKRVTRALDKLRTFYRRRGVTLEADTLAGGLSREAAQLAPAALPGIVIASVMTMMKTTTATAGAAAGATGAAAQPHAIATATLKAAATAKAKALVGVAAVALLAVLGITVTATSALRAAGTRGPSAAAPAIVPALPTTILAITPLVRDEAAGGGGARDPGSDRVVFRNAMVVPIRGGNTNTSDYEFSSDAQAKRRADGEPPRLMASTKPVIGAGALPAWMGRATPAARWRGKRLELSAYLRAEDVARVAYLHMRILSGSERVSGESHVAAGVVSGTREWTRVSTVLDVAPDATLIQWGVRLSGPGRVWMDEFAFESVPTTVSTTSISEWHLSTEWPSQYKLVNDPSEPRNGHPSARLAWTAPSPSDVAGGDAEVAERATLMRVEDKLRELRGRRVRVSAMIKAQDVARGARVFAAAGKYDAGKYTEIRTPEELPVRGTAGWLKYEATLAVPEDAVELQYGVRLEGVGTLWIDEVVLETP